MNALGQERCSGSILFFRADLCNGTPVSARGSVPRFRAGVRVIGALSCCSLLVSDVQEIWIATTKKSYPLCLTLWQAPQACHYRLASARAAVVV